MADITREIVYTQNLNTHNIKVPKFIKSPKTKQFINQLTLNEGAWNVGVMEYIPGRHPQKYNYALCSQITQQLAKNHRLIVKQKTTQKTNNSISVHALFTEPELIELTQFESPFIERALEFVITCKDFSCGYIHSDLHKENILVDRHNNLLAIIDFDDLAYLPIVYDLGSLLWSIWYNTKDKKLLKHSIQNYSTIYKLSEREIASLIGFMQLRNYYFALLEVISNPNSFSLNGFTEIECEITDLHL